MAEREYTLEFLRAVAKLLDADISDIHDDYDAILRRLRPRDVTIAPAHPSTKLLAYMSKGGPPTPGNPGQFTTYSGDSTSGVADSAGGSDTYSHVWTRFTNVITDKGKPETRVAFIVKVKGSIPKYVIWKYHSDGQDGQDGRIKMEYVKKSGEELCPAMEGTQGPPNYAYAFTVEPLPNNNEAIIVRNPQKKPDHELEGNKKLRYVQFQQDSPTLPTVKKQNPGQQEEFKIKYTDHNISTCPKCILI